MSQPKRVLITGAAGQIGYALVFLIARGDVYGPNQPVILHLLDIPQMADSLRGVVMELEDCAFPLLAGVVPTTDVKEAFTAIDACIMVGAMPRKEGMERKDLLKANAGIFKVQGKALNDYANRDVKVLVVGNPANTNCLIAMSSAPDLPRENFTCLTRLDHNRAKSQLSRRLRVDVDKVHNAFIWGNHSKTQYPDVNHGYVADFPTPGARTPLRTAINDDTYLNTEFIATVQNRGGAVIAARKLSSAASAAKAIVDHMHDWLQGAGAPGEFVSMGVVSDGSYGIPTGLIYSFPLLAEGGGRWKIVQGLTIDDFSRKKMDETAKELEEERGEANEFLN